MPEQAQALIMESKEAPIDLVLKERSQTNQKLRFKRPVAHPADPPAKRLMIQEVMTTLAQCSRYRR